MASNRDSKSESYSTTVSSRGQVVLPSGIRRKLGLRKGTRLQVFLGSEDEKSLILRPADRDVVAELRGVLRAGDEALKVLQEERRKDRERGR